MNDTELTPRQALAARELGAIRRSQSATTQQWACEAMGTDEGDERAAHFAAIAAEANAEYAVVIAELVALSQQEAEG